MKNLLVSFPIILLLFIGCKQINSQKPNAIKSSGVTVKTLEKKGGRLSLSPDDSLIAYDKRGEDGYYDIWTMTIKGEKKKCLTCDNPNLPTRNVGQPAWHPSGEYIVVQAEKQKHFESPFTGFSTNPGVGYLTDLWIIEYKSNKAWLIHEVPEGVNHGVLHPHFSKDGKKLSWSQAYKATKLNDPALIAGTWNLKVADVDIPVNGKVTLKNVKTYQPGDEVFYENHGFSPDGKKLIFTSNLKKNHPTASSDIYTLDLETEDLNQLTDIGYNEHGQFSPDGKKIIWMTTNGNVEPDKVKELSYTDWWIMNADGSNKKRLTYFNQKDHPHFVIWGTTASDFEWLPDGKGFIGYYQTFTLKNALTRQFKEVIVSVEIEK